MKPLTRDDVRLGGLKISAAPAYAVREDEDGQPQPIAWLFASLLRSLNQERRERWKSLRERLPKLEGWPPIALPVFGLTSRRTCPQCGAAFYNTLAGPNGKLCSGRCVTAARRAANAVIVEKRAARRAAARSNLHCEAPGCGKRFADEARRSTRRYCSDRCRIAAYRARSVVY
jgi:endogenous inhibitor of DNA gyrase (YacG/DUF329 family)